MPLMCIALFFDVLSLLCLVSCNFSFFPLNSLKSATQMCIT
uniref:Uncharacterized protein n=1 Tax=Rhizophora mucronata TaxID=61149 RepID=A0A2P2MK39_RHIMU